MFCNNCGVKLIDGAIFCPNCGSKVALPNMNEPYDDIPFNPNTSSPQSIPNPVGGFVLSIISLAVTMNAWVFSLGGFYDNYFALLFGIIGLILGIISLILILIHKSKYHDLHGIGIIGLVITCLTLLFAVILIIAFIFTQISAQKTVNNLNELEKFFQF